MTARGQSDLLSKRKLKKQGSVELLPGISNDVTEQFICTKLLWKTFYVLSCVSRAWRQANTSRQIYDAELLPGLPNDVTVKFISTKLPWMKTFHILSLVSRAWLQAIRSHQIYDARVSSGSAAKLLLKNDAYSSDSNRISLYSSGNIVCLPPIPHVEYRIPRSCRCLAFDGKIYILGGLKKSFCRSRLRVSTGEVFMLDVVRTRHWKKCASMQIPRENFACGVFDGKIYVFGGTSCNAPVAGCEVYDPRVDNWMAISPMISWRYCHNIGITREELLIYSGKSYDRDYQELEASYGPWFDFPLRKHTISRKGVDAYNPVKDTWRTISPEDFKGKLPVGPETPPFFYVHI